MLFLTFTLTLITEKELERVIENKGDEFRWKKNMLEKSVLHMQKNCFLLIRSFDLDAIFIAVPFSTGLSRVVTDFKLPGEHYK